MTTAMSNQVIRFYEASEVPFGVFSNYYKRSIVVQSVTYPSVEHYYQAQKFGPQFEEYREVIRSANTPNKARILARQEHGRNYPWRLELNEMIDTYKAKGVMPRDDWDTVKDRVMLEGLCAKFMQHEDLADLLLRTGECDIIENSPRDSYWGCGRDGQGQNKLGKLLVRIRQFLRRLSLVITSTSQKRSISDYYQQWEDNVFRQM